MEHQLLSLHSDSWEGSWGKNKSCSTCIPAGGVALTAVSSIASVIGSLLIICTFLCWKDLRTIARMILVFLAIADLFTGIGYLFGSAIYIHYYYIHTDICPEDPDDMTNSSVYYPKINSTTYQHLCIAQSFLTTLMPMASFFWTANLAIYLFFSVALRKMDFARTFMIVFHVTAWGIPLVTCVAIVSKSYFGPSSVTSGGWCWIKYNSNDDKTVFYVIETMAGKGWEMCVCVLALVLCVAIKFIIWRRNKKNEVARFDIANSNTPAFWQPS